MTVDGLAEHIEEQNRLGELTFTKDNFDAFIKEGKIISFLDNKQFYDDAEEAISESEIFNEEFVSLAQIADKAHEIESGQDLDYTLADLKKRGSVDSVYNMFLDMAVAKADRGSDISR